MKRTVAAASLLTAALTCLTGCSGPAMASASGSTASRTRQPAPEERLATLMVTAADLGTGYAARRFDPAKEKSAFAGSAREITVDAPACTPLVLMTNQLPLGRPQAALSRVLTPEDAPGTRVYVTLAIYDRGMGTAAVDTLLFDAVQGCSVGFTAKASGGSELYDPFLPEDAVTAGDEALAYRGIVTDERGRSRPIRTTVVRHADVIAVYSAVGGAGAADPRTLTPVIEAQEAKLG
jgi:hypothetical protein